MTVKIFKRVVLCSLVLILVLLIVLWLWNSTFDMQSTIDYNAFSSFGGFFSGVIGTFFLVIGTITAYQTFKNQLISQEKQQIESRFFELLKLHQENVNTLKSIDSNVFNIYLNIIRTFYSALGKYSLEKEKCWDDEGLLKLSYLYFFYGWNELTEDRLGKVGISEIDIEELQKYFESQGYNYTPSYKDLGIYFRQLYQTVTYIDNKNILTYQEKYEYIKILRARINVEEQYLLFLNSLVASGLKWELGLSNKNKGFITKYNLIKNIPKGFSWIGSLQPVTKYPHVLYEFDESESKRNARRAFEKENY